MIIVGFIITVAVGIFAAGYHLGYNNASKAWSITMHEVLKRTNENWKEFCALDKKS